MSLGLSERLAVHRTRQGLSLRQLGTRLGVSFSTLARIERGDGAPDRHTRLLLERWMDPTTDVTCACPRCGGPPPLGQRVWALEMQLAALAQDLEGLQHVFFAHVQATTNAPGGGSGGDHAS